MQPRQLRASPAARSCAASTRRGSRGRSRCSRSRTSASAPSPASATTRRSGSASRISRRPRRTIAWSSAISSRAGNGAVIGAPVAAARVGAPRLGAELESTDRRADQQRALAHAAQPGPRRARRVEAAAVVADLELDARRRDAPSVTRACCAPRVARDVGQRLLRDAVDHQLLLGAQRAAGRGVERAARPAGRVAARHVDASAPPARSSARGRRAPPGAAGARSRAPPPGSRAPPRAPPRPHRAPAAPCRAPPARAAARPRSAPGRPRHAARARSAARSASCAASARRALSRRSASSRSIISLNAPRQLRHLWVRRLQLARAAPGRSGSTPRMNAVSAAQRPERPPQQHEIERPASAPARAASTTSLRQRDRKAAPSPARAPAPASPPPAPRHCPRTPSTAMSCRSEPTSADPRRMWAAPRHGSHATLSMLQAMTLFWRIVAINKVATARSRCSTTPPLCAMGARTHAPDRSEWGPSPMARAYPVGKAPGVRSGAPHPIPQRTAMHHQPRSGPPPTAPMNPIATPRSGATAPTAQGADARSPSLAARSRAARRRGLPGR